MTELNKEGREKDISDEVSFYRQTKFSKTDAENITKKALGDSALKRPDKLGAYKEISTLSPDIQNLWKKIENKRIKGKSQISYAHNLLKKESIAEQEKTKLESDIDALDERDAAFEYIESIILKEKNPNEILKAIQDLFDVYKKHQQEFQKQIEEQSGDIRAQAGLRRLSIGINILLNFKNAISKIINTEEKNMTSKESSIIDSELKINEDKKNRVEGGGIEQKESLQEAIEASKLEIVNTQGDIQKEAENNDANIEQKSEGIEDPVVKDQVRTDAQKSKNKAISNGIRISEESLEKLNGIKNGQKSETEVKNPEIQVLQNRADEELRSTESALNIFKNGKSDELDSLVDQLAVKMGVKGDLKSDGVRGYIKSGLEDQRKVLHRTRALLSQSKSTEEFYNKINNELDQLLAIKNNELGQIANEKNANNKGKEEKRVNNKYNFRKGVFGSYLPTKQEIEPEPTGEPQEPKPVDQKINKDAAQAENEDDLRKLRQQLSDERKKKIEAGDMEGAKELGIKIDEINYKISFKESDLKDKKSGEVKTPDNKPQKPSEPVGEPTASVGAKSSSKKRDQLNADEAETKNKTNGPVYANESLTDDMIDDLERMRNNKKQKLNEEKNNIEHSSKEVDDKKEEPKEKTAEEILREKNIEVYGGEEKLNQIFEKYKRLNELEDRGAYSEEHPLFSEWDALRVEIANINLEVVGKDRVVNLYKIQNKDEKIREYFNTKLDEPFEFFKRDIEKESPAELAMRAATLIKYRNELKNCDWQKKDKYRDIPREKYVEIIKWLEQRIGMLNEKLPKKEGVSPEAALKDLSIDDFKKIEKDPEYKGGLPAVIEGEKVKTELTAGQAAKVENILKDFNLTAEDAEKIEGFKDLSYGQRLLALENLRQITLRDVRIGAVEKQKEEAAQTQGFWKKMWKGIKKKYDIAKHEKSIANNLSKEDCAATLTQLAKGMKEFKTGVIEKNGKLEFQYVSGLENLTAEQAARVQKFNEVASELSKLPMEWTADDSKKGFFRQMMDKAGLGQAWSPDDPTRSQHNRTGSLNAEFQTLKQEVIQILKQQKDADLKNNGIEKFDDLETQSGAVAQMLQIENLLRYNRAMNVNPEAEKALLEIKSAPLWKRALNNIATEKGIYFVAGLAARSASMTLLGTAGIVGGAAGMGGYMGYKRGKEFLRENDAMAQHKSFEETKKKRIEKFEKTKQGKAEAGSKTEKLEKRMEDANILARNLNNFVEYIKEEDDPKRRMDLSRRLRDRVKFVKDALDQGRINFGAMNERVSSLYELTDKLNDAVNCVEIYHPSTRHESDQWSEANQSKVMEKLNQYLSESKIELDAERRKYLVKQLAKGALYGAGFASAGMIARELFSHLDPHIFNSQGETDFGVRWISDKGGSGKPFVGGIVGKYLHGEPGGGGGGGHIPPHEGGAPVGGGDAEKSFFGAFADDPSKDHDMFPWQKPTTYSPEIPIGQGSFAERFLRAVGIHEGSPAKPDMQKIIAEYSEYFKHHPKLLDTQGAGNKNSLEFFSHLKSDLQNAGLDGRAADEIVKNFSFEMGKVGTGYYPEGEALSGIEATGAGTGAGAGGSAAENTITAAGAGKTIDAVIGAKQDIVNSAVETASGKMNSVWKMIDHQLDQRGIFKGLTGTPEEIAAKKTYMIDYFKDIVAKDLKGFGLKDIDDLRVGQKVDLSKLFESHPRLGEIIRDTNVLSADKLSSIYEHNQTIAEFHRLHPDVGITSENVDQIAAGHGDALLKKAVEQAVDQTAVAAPVGPVGPQKPPVVNEWHDFGGKKPEFKSPIDDLGFKEAQVDKIASEKIGDRLNKIFDYTFGKQGAETSTYQNVKNEIADNFLKRKLSGEVDVNDPFAIDRDDARRYGELQEYLKELAKENNSAPKTGETVAEFIKRAASKAARGEVGKAMESPIDKKSELI